jgi:hypothetical protein
MLLTNWPRERLYASVLPLGLVGCLAFCDAPVPEKARDCK